MLPLGWLLVFWMLTPTALQSDAPRSDRQRSNQGASEASVPDWMKQKDEGWAAYNIGRAYHLGTHGVKKNAIKAATFYRAGAEAGYAKAQANLGYCYEAGFGVERNPEESAKWYQTAAIQGDRFAQMNHGNNLLNAALNTNNQDGMSEAREWFLKAHYQDQTLTQAAYGIGVVHAQLQPKTPENTKLAKRWLALAATGNHPDAQFALGYLEEESGNGRAAFNWYKLAKDGGSLNAVFNLGRCFENGFGVAQSPKLAKEQYRLAAKSGHAQSQFALGLLVYNQAKVEADFRETYMWWSLAKMNAQSGAAKALQKLESSRLLSADGIALAKNAAAYFAPELFRAEPSVEPPFNDGIVAGADHEAFAAAGFFVSHDGWLITSAKALSLDPATHELEPEYAIKVVTEAGVFSVLDTIHLNKDESIAALKVAGSFRPLPLSDSAEIVDETVMFAVSLDSPAGANFVPQILKGTVSQTGSSRNEPFFTLNTTEIANSLSNFMVFNPLGQATGFALPAEKPHATALTVAKGSDIKAFLRNSIPDIVLGESQAQREPSEVALMDHARRGTAMVVVYRE